jgi:hypothetical protein
MFVSKIAKPQMKAPADSTSKLASPRSGFAVRPCGHGAVEQAHFLQRTTGNQTGLQLLSQQDLSPTPGENSGNHEQDGAPESIAARGAKPGISWDLGKIPIFSPDRASTLQPSSPIAATPLGAVRTKLVVGSVNDPLEHEADRMADQVTRMSAPSPTATGETLQRKCTACEEEEPGEALRVKQRDPLESSGAEAPSVVAEVLRSAGSPLDAHSRAFFEPRFGRDFSQVRVHADDRAARSAQSIGARAYTVGRHIAFAEGQYAPSSDHGRHLLAHELTHTIQQGSARIQRRPDATQQEDAGLVDNPEEMPRYEEEEAGTEEQVVRRSATWKGAAVHETVSPAETIFGAIAAHTWPVLNGTLLEEIANADAAIKVPGMTVAPLQSRDQANSWMAKVETVPAQEGGGDETVLRPGPWRQDVTKDQAGAVTRLPACVGGEKSTFTRRGDPSDDAVYKANRRHEDHHLADDRVAFEDAIGNWDKKLQDAQTAGTEFTGSSAADATGKLWAAMGNTLENAARNYRSQSLAKGDAYHDTAQGGKMGRSNPVCNEDCSTSGMDVTNPS